MDSFRLVDVVDGLTAISALLPVSVAFTRFNQYDRQLRLVAVFMLVSLGFDYTFHLSNSLNTGNNLPLAHAFVAVSGWFIGRIYELVFADTPRLQKAIRLGTVALIGFTALNTLPFPDWFDGLWEMPSRSLTMQGLFFLPLTLAYFYRLFSAEQPVLQLDRTGMFWVNSAVLIYFAMNIFAFFLWNVMRENNSELSKNIHALVNLISNVFYTIGLLCKRSSIPPTRA